MQRCLALVVALCLAAVLGAPSVTPAQPVIVWKAGTATAGGNPLNDTMEIFSKQMAERDQPPVMQNDAGCQSKNYRRTGNTYSVDIVCNGPTMKGEGKAKGTFTGPDRFTSTYDFKGTMDGQPVTQHHDSSGKWLSAECGNVKPASR